MHPHNHIFREDDRMPGYVCTICGFRIPANLIKAALNDGAKLEAPK